MTCASPPPDAVMNADVRPRLTTPAERAGRGRVRRRIAGALVTLLAGSWCAAGCTRATSTSQQAAVASPADAEALAAFKAALDEYAGMRRRIERALPRLPKQTTPEQVHVHEQALQALIAKERAQAKEGDLFVAPVRPVIVRLCREVLSRPGGKTALAEIRDESTEGYTRPPINGRYPDVVPLSAVPYDLLSLLPHLPDDLEYRFLGRDLILLDIDARVVVDYLRNALPR